MVTIIGTVLSLLLSNNLLMSGIKWLSVVQNSNAWLRSILVVLSILGVLTAAIVTGNPVDTDSISSLATALVEALALAVASHYSYKAIKS